MWSKGTKIEINESGKKKVCIIQESAIEETPVICEISALLKKNGFETHLLIDKLEKDIISELEKINPDVISIQAEMLGERWANDILKRIITRFPSKDVILFGSLPTFAPEKLDIKGVEENKKIHIISGEPERKFLTAIKKIYDSEENQKNSKQNEHKSEEREKEGEGDKGEKEESGFLIQGRVNHQSSDAEGEKFVGYDWEIYYKRYKVLGDFPVKRFLVSRGCVLSCSFCYISAMKNVFNEKMRIMEPEEVVNEALKLKENFRTKFIHFSDDLFPVWNKNWFYRFSRLWKEKVKIPFSIITLPNFIDEQTALALAESGCRLVFIGIETHNENLRTEKLMKKGVTNEVIKRCVRNLKMVGIPVGAFVMIGLPYECEDDWFSTARFLREIGVDLPYPTVFLPIPKTPLGDETIEKRGMKNETENEKRDKNRENAKLESKAEVFCGIFFLCVKSKLFSQISRELLKRNAILPLKIMGHINSALTFIELKKIFNFGIYDAMKFLIFIGDIRNRKTVLHWVA